MKFLIIKFLHRLIKNVSLNKILVLSYPIGFIYYFLTPRNNIKLNKRKKNIANYSPLLVKINYVKYWIETIWLSKEGYEAQIYQDVEIINEDEVKKLIKIMIHSLLPCHMLATGNSLFLWVNV